MIVGVMDSGIGGITTLSTLMEVCGGDFVFVSDKKGPYGNKDDDFVLKRTFSACRVLKENGAEIIVLACNTATNVAISKLREADKGFNYIGIEPAVKPALRECDKIAVALTPTAARQNKFVKLISQNKKNIKLITLPELAPAIERSFLNGYALKALAVQLYSLCKDCNGLVLGCTHYIFLREYLNELAPELKIFDGNDGVSRRLLRFTGKTDTTSVKFIKIE